MPDPQHTSHPSASSLRTITSLHKTAPHTNPYYTLLSEAFVSDCVPSAHIVASHASQNTTSLPHAAALAHKLHPLPTAVPPCTASALADLSTFLYFTFPHQHSRRLLLSFSYADASVASHALHAVLSHLHTLVHQSPPAFPDAFAMALPFFNAVANVDDLSLQHSLLHNLVTLAHSSNHALSQIVSFLHSLLSKSRPSISPHILSHLATLTSWKDPSIFTSLLLHSLHTASISPTSPLWHTYISSHLPVVTQVAPDVVCTTLALLAAQSAASGHLLHSRPIFSLLTTCVNNMLPTLSQPVTNLVRLVSHAVSAAAAVATQPQLAAQAATLARSIPPHLANPPTPHSDPINAVRNAAVASHCPVGTLVFGILHAICTRWHHPPNLAHWYHSQFAPLLHAVAKTHETDSHTHQASLTESDPEHTQSSPSHPHPGVHLMALGLLGLHHPHPTVRRATLVSLMSRPSHLLFFLPAVLKQMESESNGAVLATFFRCTFLSPALLRHTPSALLVLNTLLRLMRSPSASTHSALFQTGLVTLADACRTAPSVAIPLLLSEIDLLRQRFSLLRADTKAAACAAILSLAASRPVRAVEFIPFCALVISQSNMDTAPYACALCFEALSVMADAGVLDAVKAVKIVLKTFPTVHSVDPVARRSYLLLLGEVSQAADTKKGRALAEKIIGMLRNCVCKMRPREGSVRLLRDEKELSWEQVAQAAQSLARYGANDILRIHQQEQLQTLQLQRMVDAEEEKARVEKLEAECMEFVEDLVEMVPQRDDVVRAVQSVLEVVVEYEWKNRVRGKFDAERIAKLKATSEALRRARGSLKQKGGEVEGEENGTTRFKHGVECLPVGVIKGVCERCLPWDNVQKGYIDGRWMCMRALLKAGAISKALPWVDYIEEMLEHEVGNEEVRAAGLRILHTIGEESFETQQSRTRWFGRGSPLLDGSMFLSGGEWRELFVGMMKHFTEEFGVQLDSHKEPVPFSGVYAMMDGMEDLDTECDAFVQGVHGLVKAVCEGEFTDAEREQLESKLCETSLSRCSDGLLQETLSPSTQGMDMARVRLSCQLQHFPLIHAWLRRALQCETASQPTPQCVTVLGTACAQLSAEQRHVLLYDLNGGTSSPQTRQLLRAYSLGVAALLHDPSAPSADQLEQALGAAAVTTTV